MTERFFQEQKFKPLTRRIYPSGSSAVQAFADVDGRRELCVLIRERRDGGIPHLSAEEGLDLADAIMAAARWLQEAEPSSNPLQLDAVVKRLNDTRAELEASRERERQKELACLS